MNQLVILISGSGTNLQAILDAIQSGVLDARIEVVISNRKDAFGLIRAEQAGVSTLYFPLKPYTDSNRPAPTTTPIWPRRWLAITRT